MRELIVYAIGLIGVVVSFFVFGLSFPGITVALISVGASLAYGKMIEKDVANGVFEKVNVEIKRLKPNFDTSDYINLGGSKSGYIHQYIFIDKIQNELCIAAGIDKVNINFIPAKNVIETELKENQITTAKTTTKTGLGSLIVRTAVGGVVLGGAGAIIGGATAKKNSVTKSTTELDSTEVILTVNDLERPVYTFNFGKQAHIAKRWHGIFRALIDAENRRQGY